MQDLLTQLQAALPAFQVPEEPGEETSAYTVLEHLARFVADSFETGERDGLRPAFQIVEEHIGSGDEELRNTLAIGFLESLQNIASHRPFGPDAFLAYLGPRTRQAWDDLNVIWEGKTSLAEVIAEETGASMKPRWWQFWRRRSKSPSELLDKVENAELRAIIEGMTRDDSAK